MDLSIIIVNYNTRVLLRQCLLSLQGRQTHPILKRGLPFSGLQEVIVVDNGSTDGSPEMVAEEFPQVHLISNPQNLGYARANNQGLLLAQGDYFLLLNSDTEVEAQALDFLVEFLRNKPEAGAVGGQLILPSGQTQPSCSTDITLLTVFFEQFLLDKAFPRSRLFGRHFYTWWNYQEPRSVEVLSGACLMIRRETLRQVGLLDEAYFMYCEDADWCRRARQKGWELWYEPQARVLHYHGASSEGHREAMIIEYNRSRLIYFQKLESLQQARWAKRMMLGGALLRLLVWAFQSPFSPKARRQWRMWYQVFKASLKLDPQRVR